jgi:hypothetical protein
MGDEGPRNRRFYHRIFQLGLAVDELRGKEGFFGYRQRAIGGTLRKEISASARVLIQF